jgi:hypothetical protein
MAQELMARKWQEIKDRMSPERRARIDQRVQELLAEIYAEEAQEAEISKSQGAQADDPAQRQAGQEQAQEGSTTGDE